MQNCSKHRDTHTKKDSPDGRPLTIHQRPSKMNEKKHKFIEIAYSFSCIQMQSYV